MWYSSLIEVYPQNFVTWGDFLYTIGSLWPTLQLKVNKMFFSFMASWIKVNTSGVVHWYLTEVTWHTFCFSQKSYFSLLAFNKPRHSLIQGPPPLCVCCSLRRLLLNFVGSVFSISLVSDTWSILWDSTTIVCCWCFISLHVCLCASFMEGRYMDLKTQCCLIVLSVGLDPQWQWLWYFFFFFFTKYAF